MDDLEESPKALGVVVSARSKLVKHYYLIN